MVAGTLCAVFLIADAVMRLMNITPVREAVARVSTILYLIPRTAVLGAIVLTAYLGGATATHVRVGEPFIFPILIGVLVWAGLFLRNARLRALIPIIQFEKRS